MRQLTAYSSAVQTIALVASGQLTVSELALDHLARIEERDDHVRAWAYVDRQTVLREAKRLDELPTELRGPLFGCTVGVKDMINTKDMPTQHGSPIYANSCPGVDAAVVAVCRAAGALIIGKTHTTEFAATARGQVTCNPHDRRRTPGGSSSGSGAAVADFQCQLAIGTQTGGSMIRPGSFNGVYAFKPTYNTVSRDGVKIFALSFDTVGFFARDIGDLQLLSRVFELKDDVSPPPALKKPLNEINIAFVKSPSWREGRESANLENVWNEGITKLRSAAVVVHEIVLDFSFHDIAGGRHRDITHAEGRVNFLPEYLTNKSSLSCDLRHMFQEQPLPKAALVKALDSLAAMRGRFDQIASQFDAIVTPSVPDEAPMGLEWTGESRFCSLWTSLHVPVINVPAFTGSNGLPIGLSVVCPRYHDEQLLVVADVLAGVWGGIHDQSRSSKAHLPLAQL